MRFVAFLSLSLLSVFFTLLGGTFSNAFADAGSSPTCSGWSKSIWDNTVAQIDTYEGNDNVNNKTGGLIMFQRIYSYGGSPYIAMYVNNMASGSLQLTDSGSGTMDTVSEGNATWFDVDGSGNIVANEGANQNGSFGNQVTCVGAYSNVNITGLSDSGSGINDYGAATVITVDPQISITGSYSQFSATYTGDSINPAAPDPTRSSMVWSVVDTSQRCLSGDDSTECGSGINAGYQIVCSPTSLPSSSTYTYVANCNNVTFSTSDNYAITLGFGYGGIQIDTTSNSSYQYNLDTTFYQIPFTESSYGGASTSCTTTTAPDYYGIGVDCTGPPAIDCSSQPNVIQQFICTEQSQFNFGVIGPSLDAFVKLITSIIVPNSPTCSIPLTNVNITSTSSFPLSNLGTQVCTQSSTLRSHFPIVPVMINFAFAVGILVLIVRMINRLLNKDDNDLIVSA